MGWQSEEVWLDTDVLWFREEPRRPFGRIAPAFAVYQPAIALPPAATGLEASRRRRQAKEAARKRRLATRTVPAVALVIGSAAMLPISALRHGADSRPGVLTEDPPSLTFGLDLDRLAAAQAKALRTRAAVPKPTRATELAEVSWHRATSVGLPYSGRLLGGTQLPAEGADWVTWNPVTDSVPNLSHRLYGNERTIRTVISVVSAYRTAHAHAPRVVIGDISLDGGGRMDEHVSHQNGLDVDVYYPRLDRRLSAPIATSQIDLRLAQDLLDRFVAAGAEVVFVGYQTGLRGPRGVVVPYPNHENHMHVRFPVPVA